MKELRRATDLALRATKHTARAVGRSMAASVAAERHLWLNLTEIREREKVFLMDAPISQSGLFWEAVSAVVDKFRSAKTQSAALKQFMPRRSRDYSTPSSSVSREQSLPRKEPPSGGAQATRPSPTTVWGARGGSRCFQAFSTPHLRYVFPYTTLCFLCRTSFTNGSVYSGVSLWVLRTIRTGYTLQFGKNPPRFDGVHLTVVNSASKASVLQQELSSLLQKGAIEEVPQSDIEQGFFNRYFPKEGRRLEAYSGSTAF